MSASWQRSRAVTLCLLCLCMQAKTNSKEILEELEKVHYLNGGEGQEGYKAGQVCKSTLGEPRLSFKKIVYSA